MQADDRAQGPSGVPVPRLVAALRRFAHVEPDEVAALLWSFACFCAVLCSYYIVRPLRDEMSVTIGRDGLQWLFGVVFVVMLAAVPAFGWLVGNVPRRRVAPLVYGFFIANLGLFWLLLGTSGTTAAVASAFFVWVSVFNLFVVSLFWSVMSDTWSSGAAKRLYGFVAAGGSAGAFAGPLLTQSLVHALGPRNLLLVSAALLALALVAYEGLARVTAGATKPPDAAGKSDHDSAGSGSVLGGALSVARSPYLAMIAVSLLIMNLISTFFYFEQARIVGAAMAAGPDRVQLFARMDLAVSVLTIAAQLLLTGSLMRRLGVGPCVAALPAVCIVALAALAWSPTLPVIVITIVAERAVAFAISNPATRVLYTVVPAEDKYKAQSFIDTVVFRGGDAASGWIFNTAAKAAGLAMPVVAMLTLPFALVWLFAGLWLGRQQEARAEKGEASKIAAT